MVAAVFSSAQIPARSAYAAEISVSGFDNGTINLSVRSLGSSHTTFMDVTGALALAEAITNAANRVAQVQP